MSKTHLVLVQIFLLGLIVWSLFNILKAFQMDRGIDNAGENIISLIIFLPLELAIILKYVNKGLKSLSVESFIKLLLNTFPLVLGLFILSQGLVMYINAGGHLTIGQNVAPGALLISGTILSLIGIRILVVNK